MLLEQRKGWSDSGSKIRFRIKRVWHEYACFLATTGGKMVITGAHADIYRVSIIFGHINSTLCVKKWHYLSW